DGEQDARDESDPTDHTRRLLLCRFVLYENRREGCTGGERRGGCSFGTVIPTGWRHGGCAIGVGDVAGALLLRLYHGLSVPPPGPSSSPCWFCSRSSAPWSRRSWSSSSLS